MAVTCSKIYGICINALRSRFRHFAYHENPRTLSPTIATAGDLIRSSAVEPVVARYVQSADFKLDSPRSHITPRGFVGDADYREDVIRLFANSPYLKQASLNWKV